MAVTHIDYNTRMVKPNDDPALTRYPVYWNDMRVDNPDWSFSPTPEIELVNRLGYFEVELIDKPEGDVVEEGMPEFRNGFWFQVWNVRPFTPEEIAQRLKDAKAVLYEDIKVKIATALNAGLLVEFDGGDLGYIPMNSKNLADYSFMGDYAASLIGVDDTVTIPVQTQDGMVRRHTPQEYVDLRKSLQVAYLAFLNTVAGHRDAVFLAPTIAELPVIPEVFSL